MKKIILLLLILAMIIGVSALGIEFYVQSKLKDPIASKITFRELSELEKWQRYLYEQTIKTGLSYKDYRILNEITRCESSWRQYRNDGRVVISSGNYGLGQINKLAHEETYSEMGLDPGNPYDNLTFMVYLYKRDGLKPWKSWSGPCWLSKI